MAEFLSDGWLDDVERAAARSSGVPAELRLVVQQVVLDAPGGDELVVYSLRLADGTVTFERGRRADADVTFVQDRATAAAVAQGQLSAQSAFLSGDLRVGGDLRVALRQASAITAIDDIFAEVRAMTSW